MYGCIYNPTVNGDAQGENEPHTNIRDPSKWVPKTPAFTQSLSLFAFPVFVISMPTLRSGNGVPLRLNIVRKGRPARAF